MRTSLDELQLLVMFDTHSWSSVIGIVDSWNDGALKRWYFSITHSWIKKYSARRIISRVTYLYVIDSVYLDDLIVHHSQQDAW